MLDIDGFKQVNDGYGHKTGDRALKAVAAALRQRLRDTDVIARLGGDEFAVLLPYADARQAATVAEDLKRVIAETSIEVGGGPPLRVTASVGLAAIDEGTVSDESVLAAADRAMYRDKQSGRERARAGGLEA